MITREEVDKLAELARLKLSAEEKEKLQTDMESILGYVDQLSEVKLAEGEGGDSPDTALVRNVMREDANSYEAGARTEEILAVAPRVKNNFIKVKKILGTGDES